MAKVMEGQASPAAMLRGWDHIEWWVGNARASAGFLSSAFGFDIVAYAGPETGQRDRSSWVLQQGEIRFVVTGTMSPDSDVAEHVRTHGDGAHAIALSVESVEDVFSAAVARGATPVREPWKEEDEHGALVRASIATYGETIHTFVERAAYTGPFAPGFTTENLPTRSVGPAVGLQRIDHVVGNVELGALKTWVNFYRDVMGFDQLLHFDDDQISTEYSALMSTVVWDGSKVVMPINEPAKGRRKSQIEEYLDYYGCPGVQHVAQRTEDIISTVSALRERGVRFLRVPDSYYDDAKARVPDLDLPWDDLQRLGILVDRDQDGYLLQIFTEMIGDRPTVFFEVIQREGAKGFGAGNFKALFEAIEREQDRRGNL